jgi:hypothetical protein
MSNSMENVKHQASRLQVFAVVAFYMVAALIVRLQLLDPEPPRSLARRLTRAGLSLAFAAPDGHRVRSFFSHSAAIVS